MNNDEILFYVTIIVVLMVASYMGYKTYEKFRGCTVSNWSSGYVGHAVSDGCRENCRCGCATGVCTCGAGCRTRRNCGCCPNCRGNCCPRCIYRAAPKTGCLGCKNTPEGPYVVQQMCHKKFFKPCGKYPNMYEPCGDPMMWGPTYSVGPYPHAYSFNRVPELEN